MEAKGIFLRNNLKAEDFNFEGKNRNFIGHEIKKMQYDESKDFSPMKDMFEPISFPPKEYLRLPVDVNIEIIDTNNKIKILETLIG